MVGDMRDETLRFEPHSREQTSLVSVSTVTENSNDGAALSFSLRELDSGPDVERGGRTNVETFLVKKSVDHVNGGRVGHVDSARQEREIGGEVVGDSTLSDTLGDRAVTFSLDLTILNQIEQHTSRRVRQPSLNTSVTLLSQIPSHTGKGTTSTGRANESIELAAIGLFPDFRTGRDDVGISVGDIIKLVSPDGVLKGSSVSGSLVVVVLRVVKSDGRDRPDVGTQHPQQVNLLLRLSVRHVDDTLVSLGPADMSKTYPSVTSGTLNNSATRSDETLLLGVLDKVKGGSVLDGATRGHELGLREDIAAGLLRETAESDQRSVSDGPNETVNGLAEGGSGGCIGPA